MANNNKNKKRYNNGKECYDEDSRTSRSNHTADSSDKSGKSRNGKYSKGAKKRRTQKDSDERQSVVSGVSGGNDPKWYITDPGTLRAVANFPFGNPAGYAVKWADFEGYNTTNNGTAVSVDADEFAVPGILSAHFVPTLGVASSATSPLSMAAQSIYTFIRSANSGAKNYEPADLIVYLTAMDSLYMAYGLMARAYGTMFTTNVMNRYMPRALFEAQHLNYDSFLGRTADFKAFLDQTAIRIAQMAVPSGMTYFERHQYLCNNIFVDNAVAKAQFIEYVPDILYMYEGYSDRRGGTLANQPWGLFQNEETGEENIAFDRMIEIVNSLIDRVVTDIDCGIISGDILKAYGTDKLYRVPYIPAPYAIQPMLDNLQNLQLHNAIALGNTVPVIRQSEPTDPNESRILLADYYTNVGSVADEFYDFAPKSWIVDMPVDEVTPELMVEATRLMTQTEFKKRTDINGVTTPKIWYTTCGSEILTIFKIWSYRYDLNGNFVPLATILRSIMTEDEILSFDLSPITDMSMVNTHPAVYVLTSGDNSQPKVLYRIGQIDNYTPFDLNKLRAINNMALTAQFDVPAVSGVLYNTK